MARITITIDVPDEATVEVHQTPDAAPQAAGTVDAASVRSYFTQYLSDNGRAIFRAALRLHTASRDPFSIEQIADELGIPYHSARAQQRSTGRSAKRWRRDNDGQDTPVTLLWKQYEWDPEKNGNRTLYRLDDEVAEALADVAV